MSEKVLIVAPHPDDETLGCGGTILKHKNKGDDIYWLIVTKMTEASGFTKKEISIRDKEISLVSKKYSFKSKIQFPFETTKLDQYSLNEIINHFDKSILKIKPSIIYMPYYYDVHSDHRIIFQAVMSCTKQFRKKFIKSLRAYETLSETEFGLENSSSFKPNLFVNIDKYMKKKLSIARLYKSEIKSHPFPRSEKAMLALATLRGSMSNSNYAESFIILKEVR